MIAAPKFRDPAQLQGQTVGVSGDPSDIAVLDSVVRGSGGDPAKVKTITIGFNAVADLLAGRVAAATAFWNDEGVTLQRRQPGFHVFRVDDYGAPSYPELVVCASDAFLHAHPDLAQALVRTLTRGYDAVIRNPQAGARALESQVQGLDPTLVAAELAKRSAGVHGSRAPLRRARRPAAAPLGRLGAAVRDRQAHPGHRHHVRHAVRPALAR